MITRRTIEIDPWRSAGKWWLILLLLGFHAACTRYKPATTIEKPAQEASPARSFVIPSFRPNEQQLEQTLQKLAAEPNDSELMLAAGIMYQTLSPPDRWDYLEQAIEHLEQASQAMPNRGEAAMYLGLSHAAMARSPEVALFSKLGMARKGFSLMDQAVNLDADNLSLRLLRAKASLIAPAILGRGASLKDDRAWIQRQIQKEDEVPLHLMAMSYIFLGDHAHRHLKDSEMARAYYQKAIAAGRGTPWGEKAGDRLAGRTSDF